MFRFGDYLSNALHDIKQLTGKKISSLQGEIGNRFDPPISGDAIEKWRYRKTTLSAGQLDQLASAILAYGHPAHQREWLEQFLTSGGHTFAPAVGQRLFPDENLTAAPTASNQVQPIHPAPPLSAYAPPIQSQFVGRTAELNQLETQLNTSGSVAICGMAGMGKTSLALAAAHQLAQPRPVFWHPFYDQNLNSLVRRLAGFLTHFGQTTLWEMLEASRQANIKPPDLTSCCDTLLTQLDQLNLLLCFDDLQFVDEMPEIRTFVQRLSQLCQQPNGPKMLITSRHYPTFLPTEVPLQLTGLSFAEAKTLAAERRLELSADLLAQLHAATEGSGAFLTLALSALHEFPDPATLISQLATTTDIERFLLEEVNDRLSRQEQRVMEAVAALDGYPGGRDLIEAMLNQRDVRKTLQVLADQYLLNNVGSQLNRAYQQHQIVQGFYYQQPSRKTRRDLHQRAAEFYTDEEVDHFQAVNHYVQAGSAAQAVQVASAHYWPIVNAGMAAPLLDCLQTIPKNELDETDRFELWLIQGQLSAFLGDGEQAVEQVQQAAELLQTQSNDEHDKNLKGRVCLTMGQLLDRQDTKEALRWVQRGLDIVGTTDSELSLSLQVMQGAIMRSMGNFGGALETLTDCLERSAGASPILRTDIYTKLSAIYWHQENLSEAVELAEKALKLSQDAHSHLQTVRLCINLAPIHYSLGNWDKAIGYLEDAFKLATRLGGVRQLLVIHISLGRMYLSKGVADKTAEHLFAGLEMAQQAGSQFETHAHINLAKHFFAENNPSQAMHHATEAEAIAAKGNDQLSLAAAHLLQAQALLAQSQLKPAVTVCAQALQEAKQIGDQIEIGGGWRTQAEINFMQNNFADSDRAFVRSLQLLAPHDRYETALTQLAWGRCLIAQDKNDEAIKQLTAALATFSKLGAQRERSITEQLIESQPQDQGF